jgi:hypothetical protein
MELETQKVCNSLRLLTTTVTHYWDGNHLSPNSVLTFPFFLFVALIDLSKSSNSSTSFIIPFERNVIFKIAEQLETIENVTM